MLRIYSAPRRTPVGCRLGSRKAFATRNRRGFWCKKQAPKRPKIMVFRRPSAATTVRVSAPLRGAQCSYCRGLLRHQATGCATRTLGAFGAKGGKPRCMPPSGRQPRYARLGENHAACRLRRRIFAYGENSLACRPLGCSLGLRPRPQALRA